MYNIFKYFYVIIISMTLKHKSEDFKYNKNIKELSIFFTFRKSAFEM